MEEKSGDEGGRFPEFARARKATNPLVEDGTSKRHDRGSAALWSALATPTTWFVGPSAFLWCPHGESNPALKNENLLS
jgi:hypothetical protein